jgi:uncharacterized protein VirK/YbjX
MRWPLRCHLMQNKYSKFMSVLELEQAISQLPAEELSHLAKWFEEYLADEWDKQIERDAAAGKFDKMNAKADADFEAGRCTPL